MDNLYNILGIDKNASEQDIKKAYRKMSLKYHPDRVASKSKEEQETAAEMMQNINKAYEILSDSKKKEIYDITGSVEQAEKGEMGFGGFGESGMGSYHGKEGFQCFSHYKSIVDKKTRLDLPMRYQPYQNVYDKLIHFFLK